MIFKCFLITTCAFLCATEVFAFGGIGIGKLQRHKSNSGVDAIGVHIDANGGNETPNITLANCDAYAGTGLVDNETYNGGYAGLASDNQTQCRCPTGTKWNDGACIASEGASCTSWTTNECGTGYYCQFSPEDPEKDPTEGVCQDVSDCGLYVIGETGFVASNYDGDCSTDWWTAQSICSSQNMQLASLEDMDLVEYKTLSWPPNHYVESSVYDSLKSSGLLYIIMVIESPLDDPDVMWTLDGQNPIELSATSKSSGDVDVLCH